MKKVISKIRRIVPIGSFVTILLFILSLLIYTIAVYSPPFADFINSTVSWFFRRILSFITDFLPFSLFELLIIAALPLAGVAVWFGIKRRGVAALRYAVALLSVPIFLFSTYLITFGVAYRTSEISDNLGISSRDEISKQELRDTYVMIRDFVNLYAEELDTSTLPSDMPYSLDELSRLISEAYSALASEHRDIPDYPSRVKPVLFSTVMSSMRITGIFSPFTAEANINTEYPDYSLPFTVAHEFAHQRGIARENEANFIAHLVCTYSSDPFIRYSGYLSIYEYLASALYSLDAELYRELSASLSERASVDILASRSVSAKYKDSALGKINEQLNDLYLKSNGTDGVISYTYVVRMAVGYYLG